ncbi:MAG: Zn-ribbon domain-containing OB-fold protein [Rhodospirillaceae bacterium]
MEKAKIYTYSVLMSSTEEFKDRVPYVCAILEGGDGVRFASLVEGYKPGMDVAIGQEVRATGKDAAGKTSFAL